MEVFQNSGRLLMRVNDPDRKHRPLPHLPTREINEPERHLAPVRPTSDTVAEQVGGTLLKSSLF